MPEAIRPRLYTIPLGYSLADTLAGHLLEQAGDSRETLVDTLILLPNNRAIKTLTDSFVRRAEKGLLLPRMVAVGDLNLDEAMGPLLDPIGDSALPAIPPAISDIERRILLTRLIRKKRANITAVEALRLAKHLATALDQLDVEMVGLDAVNDKDPRNDLSAHWQSAYTDFLDIARAYQTELKKRGQLGPAARRNALLERFATALPELPARISVIAAGITTAAPAIANLLKTISRLPGSMLVWPHVDLAMKKEEWDALGPIAREDGQPPLSEETHPQYHLKLLFERMAVHRDEISLFPGIKAKPKLSVVDQIFCRADATLDWSDLKQSQKQLEHVRTLTAADSAEEALSIAILIRQALEQPEKRVALVTPDRELAVRVATQLRRWDVRVDDSAGQPLAQLPNATLLLALAELYADQIGPVSLLAVLKHPLIKEDAERLGWLEQVRALDLLLRGPRLGIGLTAITEIITAHECKPKDCRLSDWWSSVSGTFAAFDGRVNKKLPAIFDLLTEVADQLTDGKIWLGQAGRQLAQLLEDYRATDLAILGETDRGTVPALIAQLLDSEVVRPVYGSHPRVAIYGLLEARLQQADLVICSGLNEGSWPQLAQPDPWLAPRLRRELELPGQERNIGLSAHDLASLLGTPEVILTRAERDRSGPAVASRFWLRMRALFGAQLIEEKDAISLARILDDGLSQQRVEPPRILPDAQQRKVAVSVTQVDVLQADPYAFYARKILRLNALSEVDAEPDAAWRGTAVHAILEDWAVKDKLDPLKLLARADSMLANPAISPVLRTLWQPRISAALHWLADETARQQREEGRRLLAAESWGNMELAGVRLSGKADRIDSDAEGGLVIIDYKTGGSPPIRKIAAGYALQLGLVGLIAEKGGFKGLHGEAQSFEYWTLNKSRKGEGFGNIDRPVASKNMADEIKADFIGFARSKAEAAFNRWINGEEAFTAKLQPEYAVGTDYDQLARVYEWYGRQPPEQGE